MKPFILIALSAYFGIGLYLYVAQRDFIYFPTPPSAAGLPEQIFEHDGERIRTTVLNGGHDQALLYFGGNAEQVDHNAGLFASIFPEHTVYLLKYRGYSGSTGSPTQAGLYADALHIHDSIKARHHGISVIGRSLGSAVATHLAAEREIDKLVLITPFDSAQSVAQALYPIYPMSLLLKDRHDSHARAHRIRATTLIIAAEHDRIIDMRHTRRLIQAFSDEVEVHVIPNSNHNNLSGHADFPALLARFINAS